MEVVQTFAHLLDRCVVDLTVDFHIWYVAIALFAALLISGMKGTFAISVSPEVELVTLHDAIDWPTRLEKSQDCETGGGCSEMLERMSAHNRAKRIDLRVVGFQQLGQRIEG